MSKQKLRVAGYVRVSSVGQIENESLSTQRSKIREYCKNHQHQLTDIYADEGISGGSLRDRKALIKALRDAQSGKFDILIVNDLSRFGRNAQELLNNHKELEQFGIELLSIKEGINFDTPIGKTMLTMLAAIAELELTMIKERMSENRIAKALQGIPTNGTLPFGRTFDKETNKWEVDPVKQKAIKWVADKYLENESLQELAMQVEPRFGFSITYPYIATVLKQHCGTDWEINFEDHGAPIPFKIPRLLKASKIQAVKDRLAHNRTNNRTDTKNYLLTGFIRCMHCGKTLAGQTQNGNYEYYVHQRHRSETCRKFTTIPLKKIESAVFNTIFENIYDAPTFKKAIKDSLPDSTYIEKLELTIKNGEETLEKINSKVKKLVNAVINETLHEEDIRVQRNSLEETRQQVEVEVIEARNNLVNLPDPKEVKKEAERIRKELLREYQSDEHQNCMSFEDKKNLLHFLFDGKAQNGDNYGVYIDKRGKGKETEIDYFLFGRLTGLRTLRGNDINYQEGKKEGSDSINSSSSDSDLARKNSDYKTNFFSVIQK